MFVRQLHKSGSLSLTCFITSTFPYNFNYNKTKQTRKRQTLFHLVFYSFQSVKFLLLFSTYAHTHAHKIPNKVYFSNLVANTAVINAYIRYIARKTAICYHFQKSFLLQSCNNEIYKNHSNSFGSLSAQCINTTQFEDFLGSHYLLVHAKMQTQR